MKRYLLLLILLSLTYTTAAQTYFNLEAGLGAITEQEGEEDSENKIERTGVIGVGVIGFEHFYSPQRSIELRYQYEYTDRGEWLGLGAESDDNLVTLHLRIHSKNLHKTQVNGHIGGLVGYGKRKYYWPGFGEEGTTLQNINNESIRYAAVGFTLGMRSLWNNQLIGFTLEPRVDFPIATRNTLGGFAEMADTQMNFALSPEFRITARLQIGFSIF